VKKFKIFGFIACLALAAVMTVYGQPAPIADGVYFIVANNGMVLDISGASAANGARLSTWAFTGGTNQQFRFERQADGNFRITAVHSGRVLDVSGNSMADGGEIIQYDWGNGPANRRWRVQGSGGSFNIVSVSSGRFLDVPATSREIGTGIVQWGTANQANRQFRLVPLAQANTLIPVPNGTFRIVSRGGMHIHVQGNRTDNGAALVTWPSAGGANSQWRFERQGDGSYTIRAAHSNLAVDVQGGATGDSARVIQYTAHGRTNQRWFIIPSGGGYFRLVNHNSRRVLDIPGHATAQNTELIQFSDNGGTNQQFRFPGL